MLFKNIYALDYSIVMLAAVSIIGKISRCRSIKVSRELIILIEVIAILGMIIAVIGMMNISFVGLNLKVFVLLFLSGILWITFSFIFLSQKIFPEYWLQNTIISFSQSIRMTATGVLFAQMIDEKPKKRSGFNYKQLFFKPLMSGGIVTFSWLIQCVFYFERRK